MDYELLHGRRPTIAELAEIIGESENVTRNLLEALQSARINLWIIHEMTMKSGQNS